MYVAWRTWSHWKARNAATLLGELLSADRIRPTPSQRLDGLLVPPETVGAEDDDGQAGRLLVSKSGIEKLVKEERLPEASLEEVRLPPSPPYRLGPTAALDLARTRR